MRRSGSVRLLNYLLIVVAGLCVPTLILTHVNAYLTFSGVQRTATGENATLYIVVASLGLGAAVLGVVVSAIRRSLAGVVGSVVLVLLVVVAAVLFQVPKDRWPIGSISSPAELGECLADPVDCLFD